MWRLCLLAFFLLPTVQLLGQKASSSSFPPYSDTEAPNLYRALTARTVNGKTFLILADTRKPMCESFTGREANGSEFEEAMVDSVRLNTKVWSLEEILHNRGAELISQQELDSFFKAGAKGWKRFYATHPNSAGYKAFSAVGFNQQQTKVMAEREGFYYCRYPQLPVKPTLQR